MKTLTAALVYNNLLFLRMERFDGGQQMVLVSLPAETTLAT